MKTTRQIQIVLVTVAVLAATGWAFYPNPKFTPRDILQQSDKVLVLEFARPNANGIAVAKVKEILKADANRAAAKEFTKQDGHGLDPGGQHAGDHVHREVRSGRERPGAAR